MRRVTLVCWLAISIASFGLLACSNRGDVHQPLSHCDSLALKSKVIYVKMPVYQVDMRLNSWLDSAVIREQLCSSYNKCTTGFLISVTETDTVVRIDISSGNVFRYDYAKCYGAFEYLGHHFLCVGNPPLREMLKITDQTVQVRFLDFDRENDWFKYSDVYSGWNLRVVDNKIMLENRHDCPTARATANWSQY